MRWLSSWAAAIVGSAILCASGCLTSQDNPSDGGGVEDPPPITSGSGGSSGNSSQGGGAGEDTGGSAGRGGGAGRGGSGGTGNGDGGSDAGCSDDDDCAARADDKSRCSVPTGDCVECLTVADCEAEEECVNNDCRPIITCSTSDDCPHNQVCNPATARCVQCVGSNDCATGELCVSSTCRKRCTTDSQCIFLGLRCDTGTGYCASCISQADCPEEQNCQQGSCVRDICVGGSATCDGNNLATCNAAGSQLSYPVACGSQQTCTEDSSGARCEPWICQPSTTGCSLTAERVVTCSDDGLEETLVEDCAAVDQLCIGTTGGMCSDVTCEPSLRFCQGNTVQQCDSTGTTFTLYLTCPTNQLCNPQTVACAVPLCSPGQPACNGNVYTTCNADGFGYTSGGTDCTATDQFCGLTGCTTSAVDTIGASPTLYTSALSNYAMLNFYSVTGTRNLSRIEQYMSPTMATTLTWLVYESLTQTGTYTNISSTMTTSTTGAGYQSSGALAVQLQAGRFYAIGYSWVSPAMVFGFQTGTASQAVSFGALIGATFPTPPPTGTFSGASMSTANYLPQRLTTAP